MGVTPVEVCKRRLREIEAYLRRHDLSYRILSKGDGEEWNRRSSWEKRGLTRCKNIFLRNHKGNRHFLVIIDYYETLDIVRLENYFDRGKLSFASARRLDRYLGLAPGDVSLFGLLNDGHRHVEVFLDEALRDKELTFLPNCRGTYIALPFDEVRSFLAATGHAMELFPLTSGNGDKA